MIPASSPLPRPALLAPFLARQPFLVLDGGLATELERQGFDLADPLWSARVLMDTPQAIRTVHCDYLRAGADVITGASYQATTQALVARGLTAGQAEAILRRSVALATEAREEFLAGSSATERLPPLVAASIGPYGAWRADGSEYRGDYGLTGRELAAFHRPRFEILAEAGADLLAIETIPSRREAEALVDLMEAHGQVRGWLSFTTRDGAAIADGTPFAECVEALSQAPSVVAIGVNCTPAERVTPLLRSAAAVTTKPFIVYPNAGGEYDGLAHAWRGEASDEAIPRQAGEWHELGARLIGGCCRTTPRTIDQLRDRMAAR